MDDFETEEQRSKFWEGLQNGTIPVKFTYSGSAAQIHKKKANYNEGVISIPAELTVLQNDMFDPTDYYGICDIGPGNGFHTAELLDGLFSESAPPTPYLGLDFSKVLLEIAAERIQDQHPFLHVSTGSWDFETGPTSQLQEWRRQSPVLLLFLGSILSNPQSPAAVLRHIYESAMEGDRLLLGVAMWEPPYSEQILTQYQSTLSRKAAVEPLRMAGIDPTHGELTFELDHDARTVYGDFQFQESCAVTYQGATIKFEAGESVTCFRSKRFTDEELRAVLAKTGWELSHSYSSADGSIGIYLAERN